MKQICWSKTIDFTSEKTLIGQILIVYDTTFHCKLSWLEVVFLFRALCYILWVLMCGILQHWICFHSFRYDQHIETLKLMYDLCFRFKITSIFKFNLQDLTLYCLCSTLLDIGYFRHLFEKTSFLVHMSMYANQSKTLFL